jgi:hypothetical protein
MNLPGGLGCRVAASALDGFRRIVPRPAPRPALRRVQTGIGKVPIIVIRLIEKVEPVQALHPPNFYVDVNIFGVSLCVNVLVIVQLTGTGRA